MDFYQSIAAYYQYIFPPNKAQATFVQNAFESTIHRNIIDVGCGIGSLSLALSKSFNEVSGIDLDFAMVEKAKNQQKNIKNVRFLQLDMLQLANTFQKKSHDAVVCFGNTLVHLPGENEILIFFKQAHDVLKEGGKLLFQIVNYDRIIAQEVSELPTLDNDFITFERNYQLNKSGNRVAFITKLTIKENQQTIENNIDLIPIKQKSLTILLKKAGFKNIQCYGNFKKDPFSINSMALVVEANV